MLTLCASAALAADQGVDLTWNNCPGLPGAANNVNFNCTADQTFELFGTFKIDVPVPRWVAMDFVLELEQQGATSLSPFYYYSQTGAQNCNGTGSRISTNPDPATTGTLCTTFNNVSAEGSVGTAHTGYRADDPRGGHGRFFVVFRYHQDPLPKLLAKENYFAFRMSFSSNRRAECPGCGNPLAIVWNYATLQSNDGPSYIVEGPDKKSQCATLNGATAGACGATATRNTTWGQIKSLYR